MWLLLCVAASLAVYFAIIRPKLKEFRSVANIAGLLDAATATRWAKLKLWLLGQKTWFVGCAGILVSILPEVFDQLHLIDFATFLTPDLALKVSAAITLVMTITHILGLVTAAKLEPKRED